MFIDLLDRLRCPNRHEDFPLVASALRTVDRHIIEGVLGCPACGAEYAVHGGVVDFGGDAARAHRGPAKPDDEATVRLAALLGLDERGGLYLLDAASAAFARGLAALAPAAQFIVVAGAGAGAGTGDGDGAGDAEVEGADVVLRGCGTVLPLARGCARGIALDDGSAELLRSAVGALAPGGRLVAPAGAAVPDGITLLAKDSAQWVGERDAIPVVSGIRRAPHKG
jgi:uncharacterized protein YbaR (Trm112 family)